MMTLLTDELRARLEENGRRQHSTKGTKNEIDFVPVVKLFAPLTNSLWLLTEIDPEDADMAFGLYKPDSGHPELCYVSLTDLQCRFGHALVRRDEHFQSDEPLSVYSRRAGLGG